jgi:hypothetical protein
MNRGAFARSRMSPSVTVVSSTNGAVCIMSFGIPKVSPIPPQSPPVQNFTRLPASLNTTSLKIWQLRSCIFLGNVSIQIPVQPFYSSALVFEMMVPSPDPTSRKNPTKIRVVYIRGYKGGFMKTKVTLTLEDSNWQKLRIYAIENKTSTSAETENICSASKDSHGWRVRKFPNRSTGDPLKKRQSSLAKSH